MDGQNAAGIQMSEVKLNGFRREQVDGNGVTGERIHDQNIVVLGRLGSQRKARIARNYSIFASDSRI